MLSYYQKYISARDLKYFYMYDESDQRAVVAAARIRQFEANALIVKKRVKESLLSLVAHELTTPVSTIVSAVDLIRRTDTEHIDVLERACTKLLAITNRLQDMDVLTHDSCSNDDDVTYDLQNIVRSVVDSFMHCTNKARRIHLTICDEIPGPLKGNLPRIHGLILNLALLVSACGKDDQFNLSVEIIGGAARLTFHVAQVLHTYPFLDEDPNKITDLLTEPLFDSETYGGRYVGYLIATNCAELIQASIQVEEREEEDGPLTVHCTIPLKLDGDDMKTLTRLHTHRRLRPPCLRILVVDDNNLNRLLMQRIVINLGWEADVACDGQVCVAEMAKRPNYYHAIFMDCDMPVMSGYEATSYIRNELGDKTALIVALTADATTKCKRECLKAGMDDYFIKPATRALVTVMLDRWFVDSL